MNHLILLLCAVALSTLACSKVEFAPTATRDLQRTSTPPGSEWPAPEPQLKTLTETFAQADGTNKLDILFVGDSSLSMRDNRYELGRKFDKLMAKLNGVDWQLGITTTSANTWGLRGSLIDVDYRGNKVLKHSTPNVKQKFLDAIYLEQCDVTSDAYDSADPACDESNEQPLAASIMAMQKSSGENSDLFRNEAHLAVIYLSDEDEMSTGPAEATKPGAVLEAFLSIWGDSKSLTGYGIIIQPGDAQCLQEESGYFGDSGAQYGTHVNELVSLTNGVTGSVCAEDYSTTLSNIGDHAQKQLFNYVNLQHVPVSGSIRIDLSPQANIGWQVQGNQIVFLTTPPAGTEITIKYDYITQ